MTILQLCRPLSGAVSPDVQAVSLIAVRLQLCRPLSGAVRRRASARRWSSWPFNCAAPFRERLDARPLFATLDQRTLQLCRPLSGAVSLLIIARFGPFFAAFNCAAPFRERLARCHCRASGATRPLQLCRPLSGAVRKFCRAKARPAMSLQLCRPLSGAVS